MPSTKRVAVTGLGLTMGLMSARYLSRSITERRNRKHADDILARAGAALKDGLIDAESYWEMHRPAIFGPALTIAAGQQSEQDATDESSGPLIQFREQLRKRFLVIAGTTIIQPYRHQLLRCGAFPGKEDYLFRLARLADSDYSFLQTDDTYLFGIDMEPLIRMLSDVAPRT